MLPLRISNATRILAEKQDEYHALAVMDQEFEGENYMTSLWEPTPREIADLVNGGAVRLIIIGTIHPPVIMATQGPPE